MFLRARHLSFPWDYRIPCCVCEVDDLTLGMLEARSPSYRWLYSTRLSDLLTHQHCAQKPSTLLPNFTLLTCSILCIHFVNSYVACEYLKNRPSSFSPSTHKSSAAVERVS